MRAKIPTEQLQIGMRVEGLDRPWLETPFLFQDFIIRSPEDIEEVRRYCDHVYVTVPEEDEKKAPSKAAAGSHAPERLDHLWRRQRRRRKSEAELIEQVVHRTPDPVERELPRAQGLRGDLKRTLDRMYDDARSGQSVDTGYAKSIIGDLTDSVLRNPDAHMLLSQLKLKDEYAASHAMNVCSLALAFGRHMGMPRDHLEELGLGAMLIDVGNIRIPGGILDKPDRLTPEEIGKVREHPVLGMDLLLKSEEPPPAAAVEAVYTHHERMDGSGYPRGLRGQEIPLLGRMVAIVDVYDAATSERIYRGSVPPSDALRDLYNSRRGQFDEKLVEQFIQCLGIYPVGSVLECSTGERGIVIAQNASRKLRPKVLLVRDPDGRPFPVPKILDLSRFREGEGVSVKRMLNPAETGIDVAAYLRDLSWTGPESAREPG